MRSRFGQLFPVIHRKWPLGYGLGPRQPRIASGEQLEIEKTCIINELTAHNAPYVKSYPTLSLLRIVIAP